MTAGDAHAELCLPMTTGRDASFGDIVLVNDGVDEAVITGVTAVDPANLRVEESVVVAHQTALFGGSTAWPPRSAGASPERARLWRSRRPAIGYRVPHDDGTNYNLVVHTIKGDGEATLAAVRIDYTVNGRAYWVNTAVTYHLKPRCP